MKNQIAIKRFFHCVCLALCAVFAFTLVGCGDEPEYKKTIPTGIFERNYELYEPINQVENIVCDLYYITSSIGSFGERKVDVWCTYKLEERESGSWQFTYSSELKKEFQNKNNTSDTLSEVYNYDINLTCNYSGLEDEPFDFRSAESYADNGVIYKSYPAYFSTWVIDRLELDHTNSIFPTRTWRTKLFVVFIDSETTITLHEYIFSSTYNCKHDNDGNEIYEYYDYTGNKQDCWDKKYNDRFTTQSYISEI